MCIFAAETEVNIIVMSTLELNKLWAYIQGLSLVESDREWLAKKLVEPVARPTAETKKHRKQRPLSPEVEMLGNLNLREFTQEELDADPLLAAIVEDRRKDK